jgi:hypothetical protein
MPDSSLGTVAFWEMGRFSMLPPEAIVSSALQAGPESPPETSAAAAAAAASAAAQQQGQDKGKDGKEAVLKSRGSGVNSYVGYRSGVVYYISVSGGLACAPYMRGCILPLVGMQKREHNAFYDPTSFYTGCRGLSTLYTRKAKHHTTSTLASAAAPFEAAALSSALVRQASQTFSPFAENRARRRCRASEYGPRGSRGRAPGDPEKGHAADVCWRTPDCPARVRAGQRSDGLWRELEGADSGQRVRERTKGHPQDGHAEQQGEEGHNGKGGARGEKRQVDDGHFRHCARVDSVGNVLACVCW